MTSQRHIILGRIAPLLRDRGACSPAEEQPKPEDVLLAVSKNHSVEAITALILDGQRAFGENRVQEAEGKFPALRALYPDLRLHLIGPLQTNKVKAALELFDVIETVDRPALVEELAKACAARGRQPTLYIQVNTGAEPQKAGVAPGDLPALLHLCAAKGLKISGLMCIPPVDDEACLHFAFLRELARRYGLKHLSMGMSGDFETALRFGSSEVRIGTALFGQRVPSAAPLE